VTMNNPVITDVGVWGDPAHASSVVKALAGAGRAASPGRSIKRMLQLRYATLAGSGTRGHVVAEPVQRWRRPMSARKTSLSALVGATGVRATAWGERTGRVNWGLSAAGWRAPNADGIALRRYGGYLCASWCFGQLLPTGLRRWHGAGSPTRFRSA